MNANQQQLPVVLFIVQVSLWVKFLHVTIHMEATEQQFHVVLPVMLYKLTLTFESLGKIQWCDHSNESY